MLVNDAANNSISTANDAVNSIIFRFCKPFSFIFVNYGLQVITTKYSLWGIKAVNVVDINQKRSK